MPGLGLGQFLCHAAMSTLLLLHCRHRQIVAEPACDMPPNKGNAGEGTFDKNEPSRVCDTCVAACEKAEAKAKQQDSEQEQGEEQWCHLCDKHCQPLLMIIMMRSRSLLMVVDNLNNLMKKGSI